MGRPRRAPLVPIFRSDAEARILAALYLSPEPLHVRALAEHTQLPYSTVQREVDRLEAGRLAVSTRVASSRVVRPNNGHPLYAELRALLLKAFGPQFVLGDLLAAEPGVRNAYVFGSWAARYHGNWGAEWGDVDILLVGTVKPSRAEALETEIEDLLGSPTQVVVVEPSRWDAPRPTDGFIRTVKSRPLVAIDLGRDEPK